jgi:hypothetical protein
VQRRNTGDNEVDNNGYLREMQILSSSMPLPIYGRKRKCAILSLVSDHGKVTEKGVIQELIYAFYCNLMGSEEPKILGIRHDLWSAQQKVSL